MVRPFRRLALAALAVALTTAVAAAQQTAPVPPAAVPAKPAMTSTSSTRFGLGDLGSHQGDDAPRVEGRQAEMGARESEVAGLQSAGRRRKTESSEELELHRKLHDDKLTGEFIRSDGGNVKRDDTERLTRGLLRR